MAEASVSLVQDQFSCSICLDLLKDPVTIPCGHSYCMSCITDCWDQDDQKRDYSCPQCRQTFTTRPVLGKNTMLAEVVEKLKKTKLQTACPDHCNAEPGDVKCDVCTERKHKAVKSCLVCLNSYCQNHLQQHEKFFKGKRHNLIDATGRLQQMICPQHEKLLEIYCKTDQLCICYLCMVDEHNEHKTVSAATERTEKQKQLQRQYQQRIQERQQELQELRDAVETHKHSAQTAVDDTERIFTQLIQAIERRRSEVTKLIRDQEKTVVSRAEGLLKRLEQEIDDLRRRDSELEQLSHTDDHIHFLQSFQSLSDPPGSSDSLSITISSLLSFDDVGKSVSHLGEKLEDFCKEEIESISDRVKYIDMVPTPEPKTSKQFLQHYRQLTPDPNTVNNCLCLSDVNRLITYTNTIQLYPDHPDRFEDFAQVLCRESVSGRCYWEVEWSGEVNISISYKSISRKGNKSLFGRSDQSWCLICTESSCSFWHNNIETKLPVMFRSSKIGVYVDHSAGSLSFYSVSRTMILLHRVQTTFTKPLYPGFRVFFGSVKLCDPSVLRKKRFSNNMVKFRRLQLQKNTVKQQAQ